MGRPAAITYEQVKGYMDAQLAEGGTLTIDTVWEAFGNKGSKGTIHKLIKRYYAEREAQKPPESLRLLPPALQATILAFADHTAHAACEAVAAELLEFKKRADTLAEDSERLTNDLVERDEQLERAQADKLALESKVAQRETELAAAREQIAQERAAVQQATAVLARAEQRLDEAAKVRDELRQAREECEAERKARSAAELALAEMRAQKTLHEERVQDLAAAVASARAACERLEAKNAELAGEMQSGRQALAGAQRELAVALAMQGRATGLRPTKAGKGAPQQATLGLGESGAGA